MKKLLCFLIAMLILLSAAYSEPCLNIHGSFENEESSSPFSLDIKFSNQDSALTSSFTPGYIVTFHSDLYAMVSAFTDFLVTDIHMGKKIQTDMKELIKQHKTDHQEGLFSGELYKKAKIKETCSVSLEELLFGLQDNARINVNPFITSSFAENLKSFLPAANRFRMDLCSLDGGACYSIQLVLDGQVICTGEINLVNPDCTELLYEYCNNERYFFHRITLKTDVEKREITSAVFSSNSASFSNITDQNRILEEMITFIPQKEKNHDFIYRFESDQIQNPVLFSGEIISDESGVRLSGSTIINPQSGLNLRLDAALCNESDSDNPEPDTPVILDLSDETSRTEFNALFLSGLLIDLANVLPDIPEEYIRIIYSFLMQ